MSEDAKQSTLTERAGGRKALGFYAALGSCLLLALLDKAHTEVLGLIDTLYLFYAGANVVAKRQPLNTKEDKKNE